MNKIDKMPTAILAIIACFLWSTAFATIKIGQEEYSQPFSFAGIRFMISGIMLLPLWGGLSKQIKSIQSNIFKILVLAVVNTFLHYGLFYISIYHLPGSLVAIIIGSSPLITALIAFVFVKNEHVGTAKLITIICGVAGIAYISIKRNAISDNSHIDLLYISLLIGAVTCGVLGSFIVAKHRETNPISPIVLTSTQIFIGGLLLFIVSLFTEGVPNIFGKSSKFYASLGWLAFLSAAGFSIWFTLLRRPNVTVTDINRWKFIIPLFGAVLSWLIIDGEQPTIHSVIGMIIVLLSVSSYEYILRKESKSTSQN